MHANTPIASDARPSRSSQSPIGGKTPMLTGFKSMPQTGNKVREKQIWSILLGLIKFLSPCLQARQMKHVHMQGQWKLRRFLVTLSLISNRFKAGTISPLAMLTMSGSCRSYWKNFRYLHILIRQARTKKVSNFILLRWPILHSDFELKFLFL